MTAIILIGVLTKLAFIYWLTLCVLTIIFVFQLIWLYPILSHRVDVILTGQKPRDSYAHLAYGLLEVAKFFILVSFGMLMF